MLRPIYHAAVTEGGCAKARREDDSSRGHVDLEAADVDCYDVTVHMLTNKSHYAREDVLGMFEEDLAAIAEWVRQARDQLLAVGKVRETELVYASSLMAPLLNSASRLLYMLTL